MLNLVDAHNHIKEQLQVHSHYNCYKQEDIKNIGKVSTENISIGIHPLYIEESIEWDYIEQILINNKSLNIGEVGLDKRGADLSIQLKVFNKFINLSKQHDRSISIHCVKSWGNIVDIIKTSTDKDLPHLYHGFSGSKETMKVLSSGNSFFSFSSRELRIDRINQLIKSIPVEKLLIESDMLNSNFIELDHILYLDRLKSVYAGIASIKKLPIDELIPILENNFYRFLRSN